MKIVMYSYREDEIDFINEFSKKYNIQIQLCKESPSLENTSLAKDALCISIITTKMSKELIGKFYDMGVRYISTRTIGYDHIDVEGAKEIGMAFGNVKYSPNSVAEYTVMMIIMALRNMNLILTRYNSQDYALNGIRGQELAKLTVGIIGTGNIGTKVIKKLSGFETDIIAYDLYENDEVKKYASYVSLEELYRKSDVISLHLPATDQSFHMIDKAAIETMKDGVIIINTARGSLINTSELISALKSGKVKGAALDVIEGEELIYYQDFKGEIVDNSNLAILQSFPNVILTPHTAFYTDKVVSDMVENSIINCKEFMEKFHIK